MAIPFPTSEDAKRIKEHLDRLIKPDEEFNSQSMLFTVKPEEVATVENACITILKELETIMSFCTCSVEEVGENDLSQLVSLASDDIKDKSVCSLIKSNKMAAYMFPTYSTLTGIHAKLSNAREYLERFNAQHGYLYSIDIILLKKGNKSHPDREKSLQTFSKNSKERLAFINAVDTIEQDQIPSKYLRCSFHSFIVASKTVVEWISVIDAVKNREGNLPMNRAVIRSEGQLTNSIKLYQLHNCTQIYEIFTSLFKEYFCTPYQQFCEEIGGNVLDAQFIPSFRGLLEEFLDEIRGLETTEARHFSEKSKSSAYPARSYVSSMNSTQSQLQSNSTSNSNTPTIIFNPSLNEFHFLYKTLILFLSTSIHAEGMQSVKYFEVTYETLSKNSYSILEKMKGIGNSFHDVIEANGDNPLHFFNAEKNNLKDCIGLYNDLRKKIHATIKRLEADLLRARKLFFTINPLSSAFLDMTKELQELELSLKDNTVVSNSTSWWNTCTLIFKKVLNAATCTVEYNPSGGNDVVKETFIYNETPVTFISTYFARKEQLLVMLKKLSSGLLSDAEDIEKAHPGLFVPDQKKKLLGRVETLISNAEKYSVLFKAPDP